MSSESAPVMVVGNPGGNLPVQNDEPGTLNFSHPDAVLKQPVPTVRKNIIRSSSCNSSRLHVELTKNTLDQQFSTQLTQQTAPLPPPRHTAKQSVLPRNTSKETSTVNAVSPSAVGSITIAQSPASVTNSHTRPHDTPANRPRSGSDFAIYKPEQYANGSGIKASPQLVQRYNEYPISSTGSYSGHENAAMSKHSLSETSNGDASSLPVSIPSADTLSAADGSQASGDEGLDDVEMRRSRCPFRHAQSETQSASLIYTRRCSQQLVDAKEHAYARLMQELSKAQRELQLKDEECDKLSKVRYQMEEELEDLTASLFEEANKMVQEANIKRMNTEKLLAEATEKIDVLQAEVAALKQLVLTSTPSSPNKHLHPQISNPSPKKEKNAGSSKPFWKSHRRSTSHHEFTKQARLHAEEQQNPPAAKEMDTMCYDDFQRWKLQPSLNYESLFLRRVIFEDIQPCLNFRNKALAERVRQNVERNSLTIEPIPGDCSFPRKCCLSEVQRLCNYKIKLEDDEEWYSISQLCRNRIAAVCNFYTYIRYIVQGLVKSSDREIFQETLRLRMQMAVSRLGL